MNERGFRTIALDGSDSEEMREKLDYILSVDIFSEGTDMVKVNKE